MIRTLQRLGYFLAAFVVFCVVLALGAAAVIAVVSIGAFGLAALVIFFIAICIKEYFEQPVSSRKDEGSERGSS